MNDDFRKWLLVVLALPATALAYYFGIALPQSDRARFQFERDKYAAEIKEKAARETKQAQEQFERKTLLDACAADADTSYWTYVKLNGTAVANKPGAYSAPTTVWSTADKRKKDSLEECHKQFDK